MKKGILALLVFAAATAALGDLNKYKDWPKSPEAYFLTPAERGEWIKLTSDDDAEKFIALYWAKRGGDAFKGEVSRRIAAADQQFKMRRYERGSLSVRGRLIVVLGPPNKQMRERAQETAGNTQGSGAVREDLTTSAGGSLFLTWIYEHDHFPADWGVGELRVKILIDQVRGIDELQIGAP
ncbi:MAG TPA: GWxTD domain-containing protein, partial [Thermoanaerobaculia bacterium]|nr:GWxTD domain-containing protein [Thermoanaerobaculia bacterium]